MCDEGGVFLVRDDDGGETFGAAVGVEDVSCKLVSMWVYSGRGRGAVHCSRTSCRDPGLVLSATFVAKNVINSEILLSLVLLSFPG